MDKKITRKQAIETMVKMLKNGFSIPMCSAGDGYSSFSWASPHFGWTANEVDIANFLKNAKDTKNFSFHIVPMDEIMEDFRLFEVDTNGYDVCVEFKDKNEDDPYVEQYLLWWPN